LFSIGYVDLLLKCSARLLLGSFIVCFVASLCCLVGCVVVIAIWLILCNVEISCVWLGYKVISIIVLVVVGLELCVFMFECALLSH
jgi:hypothetical protein